MRELVSQAGKNDNISTIYVSDSSGVFYGAIDLKDLIIAREYVQLESLIATSYPFLNAHEKKIAMVTSASVPWHGCFKCCWNI